MPTLNSKNSKEISIQAKPSNLKSKHRTTNLTQRIFLHNKILGLLGGPRLAFRKQGWTDNSIFDTL